MFTRFQKLTSLLAMVLAMVELNCIALADIPKTQPTPPGMQLQESTGESLILSPISREMAKELGVMDMVIELQEMHRHPSKDLADQIKHLELKQNLSDTLLAATLDVRDVTARIDKQIAIFNRMGDALSDRRDRASRINSWANVGANGIMNEIGQAGEMKVKEAPGEELELVAGGLTILLGALALQQQKGAKQRITVEPNMLAKAFGCQVNNGCDYPATVWTYLNTVPPGSADTRLNQLMLRWRKYKVIGNPKTPEGRKRISLLTNTWRGESVTIDLLGEEMNMLAELRSEIFQMDRDILQLLNETRPL